MIGEVTKEEYTLYTRYRAKLLALSELQPGLDIVQTQRERLPLQEHIWRCQEADMRGEVNEPEMQLDINV